MKRPVSSHQSSSYSGAVRSAVLRSTNLSGSRNAMTTAAKVTASGERKRRRRYAADHQARIPTTDVGLQALTRNQRMN